MKEKSKFYYEGFYNSGVGFSMKQNVQNDSTHFSRTRACTFNSGEIDSASFCVFAAVQFGTLVLAWNRVTKGVSNYSLTDSFFK